MACTSFATIHPASPPTTGWKSAQNTCTRSRKRCANIGSVQLSDSLNFFRGSTLTVWDFGFALKTHGSLVKGFTPLRAGTAGFNLSFILSTPANLKEPFFFSSFAAISTTAPKTALTSLGLRPVVRCSSGNSALRQCSALHCCALHCCRPHCGSLYHVCVEKRGAETNQQED